MLALLRESLCPCSFHGHLAWEDCPLSARAPQVPGLAPHLGGGWGLSISCNGFQLYFLLLGLLYCWLLHNLLFLFWAGSPGRSAGEKNKGMFTGVIGNHPVVCWGPVGADSLDLHPSSFTQGTCHVWLDHKCYWVGPRIQAPGHTFPCLALSLACSSGSKLEKGSESHSVLAPGELCSVPSRCVAYDSPV